MLDGRFECPRNVDEHAKDLIRGLLMQDRTKRLGCIKVGETVWVASAGASVEGTTLRVMGEN